MKFVNAAKFYKAKILILGGDITGKMVIPVVHEDDDSWQAELVSSKIVANTKEELLKLEKDIRDAGFYPYLTTPSEVAELDADRGKVDALFTRLMCESVTRWMQIANDRLAGTGALCYISPGNDDRWAIDACITDTTVVKNPEGRVVQLTPHHEMVTLGYSNPTPWHTPREATEEELASKISSLLAEVKDMSNAIFNFHCPPINAIIDQAPRLDSTLKPVMSGGQIEMIGAGSSAVRESIEKHQPLLGLHGHIHESKGVFNLGRTICLNPGSEYGEGILRGLIFELGDKGGLKNYMFTSG